MHEKREGVQLPPSHDKRCMSTFIETAYRPVSVLRYPLAGTSFG